jgi:hypothetical protein
VLTEIAGLPGAPARVSQAAAVYRQGTGNSVSVGLVGPPFGGRPPDLRLLLPDQLLGPPMTTSALAAALRSSAAPAIVADVIGGGPGASPAQQAVTAALTMAADRSAQGPPPGIEPGMPSLALAPGSPAFAAARRFAALPASARHTWLVRHLAALRAGQVTLAQLP